MKWLFIFPALIAASWVVMASQSALAFGFAQGVIVDGKGSVVYLMDPGGGIDAVNLSGGGVLRDNDARCETVVALWRRLAGAGRRERRCTKPRRSEDQRS